MSESPSKFHDDSDILGRDVELLAQAVEDVIE
jgi:hypothetical protein